MALPLETGGIKSVSVMAQVLSGGEATCTLNLNDQGSFTVPGTPATITIRSRLQFYAFPRIDAGNGIYFATVTCLASGDSKFRWQGVVYNP